MDKLLQQRLQWLTRPPYKKLLKGGKKGIEKESLRITLKGELAQTPHPRTLGSALTHPYITTDYSEALLEFVTPPYTETREMLAFLSLIHQFTYQQLDQELLWATSMPCAIKDDLNIPIAHYGHSNVGQMKHIYRRGLGYRYGRRMQTIAGIHFNYSLPETFWLIFKEQENDSRSLPEFINGSYFHLLRNFHRLGWLIPYLFGTSPTVCKSFLKEKPEGFLKFDQDTYFLPYATSLRMSDIGYKNKTQANMDISYNTLSEYVTSLTRAMETPFAPYQDIGVIVNGEYRQLSTNILQIENEYYSFIRPKQTAHSGEKPTLALKRRGVQYVEVRALDISAYDPLGTNEQQLYFLEALLILCLLKASPMLNADERREVEYNQKTAACCGRDPHLKLQYRGQAKLLQEWAQEICDEMRGICELLDQKEPDCPYTQALTMQLEVIAKSDSTPSARMLTQMREKQVSFQDLAMELSQTHASYFKQLPLKKEQYQYFTHLAQESWAQQQAIEATDHLPFQKYLDHYFSQQGEQVI